MRRIIFSICSISAFSARPAALKPSRLECNKELEKRELWQSRSDVELGFVYTHSVSHAHFFDTFSLRGVQTSGTRMAQGGCSAHVTSLHLTFSILMFHLPSLLFPDGHFETTFPTLTFAPSLPNCSRSESADQAHFRTSGGEFWLPGRSHALHKL